MFCFACWEVEVACGPSSERKSSRAELASDESGVEDGKGESSGWGSSLSVATTPWRL